MWLLRAFRDAVITAVLTAIRGWISWLWRPLESTRLIAALPRNLWRTWRLLGALFGAGLTVNTPPGDAPMLRTAIVGLGDLTTRVVDGPTLTEALVAHHLRTVREQLEPLSATPEALSRVSALGMVAVSVYVDRHAVFHAQDWLDLAFRLIGSAFIVSFTWTFGMRLFAVLAWRVAQRWFDRERAG